MPRATPYAGRVALVGLERPREVIYRRIDERAAWLFANGLLDEVRALRAAGFGPELHPMTGHGYAEAAAHLAGEWSLDRGRRGHRAPHAAVREAPDDLVPPRPAAAVDPGR